MSTILTNLRIRQTKPVAAAAFVALTLEACGGHHHPPPAPTVTLSVSPTTITVGQSATLTWSSTNAVSCAASGTGTGSGWTGNEQLMGTATDTPPAAATVTYTLTCTGAGGGGGGYGGGGGAQTAMASATLTVNAPPQTAFVVKPLVADGAGVAATQDKNLVNAWGLVFAPNDPVWIANNATATSTLYDGNGTIEPSAAQPLVVALPAAADGTAFKPTGIVAFDGTKFPNDFKVTVGTTSGQAAFIYSGQGGQLAAWVPKISFTQAVSVYAATDKACYRGLAIANNGTANFLYANDFLGAKIDVFDATWKKQDPATFSFADPNLPANYAPFNIQAIPNGPGGATQLYVSYAKAGSGANVGTCEDTRGAGFGAINVFDANGKLVTELVKVGGALNAPWGMALAPKDFGTMSNLLLVSNHADGMINGYDPVKGTWVAALQTSAGAFAQPGLWGIAFGNDGKTSSGVSLNQPHNTLFFTAGPNEAANGLYGRIDLPAM